jgi:hypothetical protein
MLEGIFGYKKKRTKLGEKLDTKQEGDYSSRAA